MSDFPHINKLSKSLDAIKHEIISEGHLFAALGTKDANIDLFAVSYDRHFYSVRLSISAPDRPLSEENVEKLSSKIEDRLENYLIAEFGEDEGDELATALIFVNVLLNGEEVY